MKLIHYGAEQFDDTKWTPIGNRQFLKPYGGLWTSPVGSNHSWGDWCRDESFHLDRLKTSFTCALKESARILTINTPDDVIALPHVKPVMTPSFMETPYFYSNLIDFEAIAQEYDAIHLTEQGELSTRFSEYGSLYGWDCETVLIMNKDVILC